MMQLVVGDQVLDVGLDLVGQLEAVGAEELDPVVLVGIVRGADHRAGVGPHRDGELRDGRRRKRPAEEHVDAHAAQARGQRRLQHVPRNTSVFADHHPVAVAAPLDGEGHGAPELEHQLARHRIDVGDAADAVGAEELAGGFGGLFGQADGHVGRSIGETQMLFFVDHSQRVLVVARKR